MTATRLLPLDQLITDDLNDLIRKARPQFDALAGHHLWLTGGAGFLGYYLVLSIGHWNKSAKPADRIRLTVLDNYIRGVPSWLEGVRSDEIRLVKHDVTHPIPADLAPADYIIHAASIASPMYYRKYPLETIDANVNGLRLMLDHAAGRNRAAAGSFKGRVRGRDARRAARCPRAWPAARTVPDRQRTASLRRWPREWRGTSRRCP